MYSFLRQISMITLLRVAGEMLLPEGKMHDMCNTVLGLMSMACMLSALKGCLMIK